MSRVKTSSSYILNVNTILFVIGMQPTTQSCSTYKFPVPSTRRDWSMLPFGGVEIRTINSGAVEEVKNESVSSLLM